jgi:hypothetical protein
MLVMCKYSFHAGPNAAKSLARFIQWTPPDGFVMKDLWMASGHSGFFLGETDGVAPLMELTAQYADLAFFEIHPVVLAEEGVPVLQRGFEYAAAH